MPATGIRAEIGKGTSPALIAPRNIAIYTIVSVDTNIPMFVPCRNEALELKR